MHNWSNQREICFLGSAFLHLPSNTLIHVLFVEGGWGIWEKKNPAHFEEDSITEPFISHSSERPYISNNKPKRHMMTQMWFCWNPIQFHCPLFVPLLIHFLKQSHFFENVYTDMNVRWNIPLQKYWFEDVCLLGLAPKRHKAYSISMDFMASIYKHPQGHENNYMPTLLQNQQVQTRELPGPSLLLSASFVSLPIMYNLCCELAISSLPYYHCNVHIIKLFSNCRL